MQENLERLRSELAAAMAGLNEAEMGWRPEKRPEAWTIAQIVQHLLLTYGATRGAMRARLEKGTPTKGSPSMAQRAGQFAVTKLGYFPQGRKAPPQVEPAAEMEPRSGEAMVEEMEGSLREMSRMLDEAEARFGSGRCVTHVVLGPMSIEQWRSFHLAHGLHHVKQIRSIREQHGGGVAKA